MPSNPEVPPLFQPVVMQPPKPLTCRIAALLRDWDKSAQSLLRDRHEDQAMVLQVCGQQLFEEVTVYMREAKAFTAQLALAKAAQVKRAAASASTGGN